MVRFSSICLGKKESMLNIRFYNMNETSKCKPGSE